MSAAMKFSLDDRAWASARSLPAKEKRDYSNVANHSSNELNHPLLEQLVALLRDRVTASTVARYPSVHSERELVARGLGIDPSCIALCPGSDAAILQVLWAFCARTRALVLDAPNYPGYERYATALGLSVREVGYRVDARRRIDALIAAIPCEPGAVVITNPHAFTGEVVALSEVERLADACADRGQFLIVDEAYGGVAGLSHEALALARTNVLVLRSFSKSFGMAGLRAGVVIGNAENIRYARVFGAESCVSSSAFEFAKICLEHGPLVRAMWRDVSALRDELADATRRAHPTWWVPASRANFLLVDPRDTRVRDRIVHALADARIVVRSLAGVRGFESALRFSIGAEHTTRLAAKIVIDASASADSHEARP